MRGKKVAVIGGTNGIGRSLAQALASRGAEVLVVGRTFLDDKTPNLQFMHADLSSLKCAQKIAQELPAESLDMIIMTQGIFCGKQRLANSEGIEIDLAVSYLSRFVIVRHVAERMGHNTTGRECKPRVFIMGFPGLKKQASLDDLNSEKYYNWWAAHRNGVVGNEALVLDSAERYASVNFYGLNPGVISTNIMSGLIGNGSFFLRMQQY